MKREILIIPFFGWAISRLRPISINRKLKIESLKKVSEVGGERIREGYALLIFPEGTRKNPQAALESLQIVVVFWHLMNKYQLFQSAITQASIG